MRNFALFRSTTIALVCLAFTGADVAWADDGSPTAEQIVPTPMPNSDSGSSVRAGTAIGFMYGAPTDVIAFGGTVAVGQRFGRLVVEGEYSYLTFQAHQTMIDSIGASDGHIGIGNGHRLDAIARFDALRFGPTIDKRRSLITLYVEGGIGSAWNHWTRPTASQADRIVPNDTKRTEAQAGFGLMIFPHRVAWLLGWRFAFAPHEPMAGTLCRGVSCRSVTMTDDGSYVDRSMLFQSSLEFTF
jgi:hypothetical protein